ALHVWLLMTTFSFQRVESNTVTLNLQAATCARSCGTRARRYSPTVRIQQCHTMRLPACSNTAGRTFDVQRRSDSTPVRGPYSWPTRNAIRYGVDHEHGARRVHTSAATEIFCSRC